MRPLQSFVVNVCNRILIFFLSIKAWEEKSLPKSHLGWFFSVFGEGKATMAAAALGELTGFIFQKPG